MHYRSRTNDASARDIGTVEYGWPVGMPLCQNMGEGLWEARCSLPSRRIARVLFCRMETSRPQLDRLLDPDNGNVTLDTLAKAAAVGRQVRLELV